VRIGILILLSVFAVVLQRDCGVHESDAGGFVTLLSAGRYLIQDADVYRAITRIRAMERSIRPTIQFGFSMQPFH
jgi:hypothetical protein